MVNIIDINSMYISRNPNAENGNENFDILFNGDIKICVYDFDIRIFNNKKLIMDINTYPIPPKLFISQMINVFHYKDLYPCGILIKMNKK